MIWNLMLFIVHVTMMLCLCYLYKSAPCWMQRLIVVGLILGMLLIATGYGIDFMGDFHPSHGLWAGIYFKAIGLLLEHVAVMIYVFRLVYQEHAPSRQGESGKWPRSAHLPA